MECGLFEIKIRSRMGEDPFCSFAFNNITQIIARIMFG
jgi:hypothetical protein